MTYISEWRADIREELAQGSDGEDGLELVKNEGIKCGECFNYSKKGHLARDGWSPRKH